MDLKKNDCFRKRCLIFLLISLLLVGVYWFKVRAGINLFDSVSIGSHFPFKYFTSTVIRLTEPGTILEENFNKKRIFKIWSNLWMREDGSVIKKISSDGVSGSKCLLIENSGKGSWSYSHNKHVEVKKGDMFCFEGDVNIKGDGVSAYLSVAAFDENQNNINWNLYKEKVNKPGCWNRVKKEFNISNDEIRYISFRLTGAGEGEFRFDNIIFRKIK